MKIFFDIATNLKFPMKSGPCYTNLKKQGYLNHDLVELCQEFSNPREYMIDVGAEYGLFPLMMSFAFKKVYSFESSEELRNYLRDAINLNRIKNVVIQEEVSSVDHWENMRNIGFISFYIDSEGVPTNKEFSEIIRGSAVTLIDNNFPSFLFQIQPGCLEAEDCRVFIEKMGYTLQLVEGREDMYLAKNHPRKMGMSRCITPTWETYYSQSQEFRLKGENLVSFNNALYGLTLAPPDKVHLLYEELSVSSYYVGKKELGADACERVISSIYSTPKMRELAISNSMWYIDPLICKKRFSIPHTGPDNFIVSSASLVEGSINIRYINYILDSQGEYIITQRDGITRTINYLLEVELAEDSVTVLSETELLDKSSLQLFPSKFLGMEDVRLFGDNNFFCTSLETNPLNFPQMCWGKFGKNGEVEQLIPLSLPGPPQPEKNWLPFMAKREIFFVYSFSPFTVYKISTLGDITPVSSKIITPLADFRGSASPIPYILKEKSGWLCTTHQVTTSKPRKYLHRFVWFDEEFSEIKYSRPFLFEKTGVEYNLGILLGTAGLFMTYSVDDCSSRIILVDLDTVNSLLE